ncbi:MAG: hypothetical protein K0R61_5233 [Microvirga sp.]|jgi:hypothetical protein|nr:hypothetical protein [Microvirga sp.]
MPYGLFFFDVTADGSTAPDDDGADCFDASAARAEAAQTAAEMLKDKPLREGPVTIVVRDQTGDRSSKWWRQSKFRRWANRAETLPRFVILFPRRKTSRAEISKDPTTRRPLTLLRSINRAESFATLREVSLPAARRPGS